MRRHWILAFIAGSLASLGQWGLLHFSFSTLLGLPGFDVAMLFGVEGHAGHSTAALYIEIISNFLFYLFALTILFHLLRKLLHNPAAERSLYDHC